MSSTKLQNQRRDAPRADFLQRRVHDPDGGGDPRAEGLPGGGGVGDAYRLDGVSQAAPARSRGSLSLREFEAK